MYCVRDIQTQYLLSFLSLGILNPLDTPHHMTIDEDAPFREGVVLDRPVKMGAGSFVNAGMRKEVRIDKALKPGLRVTVKFGENSKTGMCSFEHFKFALSANYSESFDHLYARDFKIIKTNLTCEMLKLSVKCA